MGTCRQTFSLWFYIRKVLKPFPQYHGRWECLKDLFRLKINDSYFWHDSFGRYFNQIIFCPVFGHRSVHWLSDGGCSDDRPKHYCFNCEREVNSRQVKIRNKQSV